MRERHPGDWAVDLAGRHRLEHQVAEAIAADRRLVLLRRTTDSLRELDYAIAGPGQRLGYLELKAKHQPYRGWSAFRPEVAERDLFILDELALRKIVGAGRYAHLVVADLPTSRWCIWSSADLVLATKARVVRALATGAGRSMAKVLLDQREAAVTTETAAAAVDAVARPLAVCDAHWDSIEPWPYGPAVHHPLRRPS